MGNNARKMLVLANAHDIPAHLALLKKILRAINCDFDQDILFATAGTDESIRLLNTPLIKECETLFLFGIPPQNVGVRVHSTQRILHFTSFRILLAPALSVLAGDDNQKRALWSLLKQAFPVAT